jgi:hypothetical protein
MSIRLDPRRLSTLKRLAADAGMRPGDLVRTWVEERIDGERTGAGGASLVEQLTALTARVEALERSGGSAALAETAPAEAPEPEPAAEPAAAPEPAPKPARAKRKASAKPADKVALHDEMIAVLSERGPMTAAELAAAVTERGRYHPPRSGKPIDAAMISQRVSNPTYRPRFTRAGGRIGLAG